MNLRAACGLSLSPAKKPGHWPGFFYGRSRGDLSALVIGNDLLGKQKFQELFDRVILLDRMSEGTVHDQFVMVTPPFSADLNVSVIFQFVNDPLRSSFRDPDPFGDMTKLQVRILGKTEQHVGVIRKKRPSRGGLRAGRIFL